MQQSKHVAFDNLMNMETIFTPDTSNILFQLAVDLVNQSDRNIFLTGKAGTGKTTFLKYIRDNCPKQMAIVAPTGVAAINAGGVTIHSFFQLPLSPFIPASGKQGFNNQNNESFNRHSLISRMRINSEKRKVWEQLELLVIDEISMVRCDLLDAVDTVLRYFRKRPCEKFGGVQVLFIGDMFQLPPVVRDQEWRLLSDYYESPYFFASQVLKDEPPLYIEFDKIYRQSEEVFIKLLNQVRNNELDSEGYSILESRFFPSFRRSKDDGYIILTTHNEQARTINLAQLNQLPTAPMKYEADIKNDFQENAYPADQNLVLKEGAQVMFIRNDSNKRYFNGKIGTVSRLEEEKIFVRCEDVGEVEVKKEEWKNIRYSIDKSTHIMKEEELGSFSQFPLRLAWAITIHKSQGLTFNKAIIDAGEAFAPGQVYVALSRCTNLDGMILRSRLRKGSLLTDQRIVEFSRNIGSQDKLQKELQHSKKKYQEKILLSAFDFRLVTNNCKDLKFHLAENKNSFTTGAIEWIDELLNKINRLDQAGNKIQESFELLFLQPTSLENDITVKEKISASSTEVINQITELIIQINQSSATTDSTRHAKEYNDGLREIFAQLSIAKHLLQGLHNGLDISGWHQRRKNFEAPAFKINAYAGNAPDRTVSPHPILHKQLRQLRDKICFNKDIPIYLVAGTVTLDEMARFLPLTLTDLRKVSGFGDARIEKYGQQFLNIILAYCNEHELVTQIHEKPAKRERLSRNGPVKKKGDSQTETFMLFQQGKSIPDIARERNLAISTIEGHLEEYVRKGEIPVHVLVSEEKIKKIEIALKENEGTKMTPLKEKLGDDFSYVEIRFVMASKGIVRGHPVS